MQPVQGSVAQGRTGIAQLSGAADNRQPLLRGGCTLSLAPTRGLIASASTLELRLCERLRGGQPQGGAGPRLPNTAVRREVVGQQ